MWKTKYMEGLRKRKLTELLPIKALPEILVDVVASYAVFTINIAPKLLAIAEHLGLSGHCT